MVDDVAMAVMQAAFHASRMDDLTRFSPRTGEAAALADKIEAKKAGHRTFPSLAAVVNIGWIQETERDMIVAALRLYAQSR